MRYRVWWIVDDFTSSTCSGRIESASVNTLDEAERIRSVLIERLNLAVTDSGIEAERLGEWCEVTVDEVEA